MTEHARTFLDFVTAGLQNGGLRSVRLARVRGVNGTGEIHMVLIT